MLAYPATSAAPCDPVAAQAVVTGFFDDLSAGDVAASLHRVARPAGTSRSTAFTWFTDVYRDRHDHTHSFILVDPRSPLRPQPRPRQRIVHAGLHDRGALGPYLRERVRAHQQAVVTHIDVAGHAPGRLGFAVTYTVNADGVRPGRRGAAKVEVECRSGAIVTFSGGFE
jgi:hypothetical protein